MTDSAATNPYDIFLKNALEEAINITYPDDSKTQLHLDFVRLRELVVEEDGKARTHVFSNNDVAHKDRLPNTTYHKTPHQNELILTLQEILGLDDHTMEFFNTHLHQGSLLFAAASALVHNTNKNTDVIIQSPEQIETTIIKNKDKSLTLRTTACVRNIVMNGLEHEYIHINQHAPMLQLSVDILQGEHESTDRLKNPQVLFFGVEGGTNLATDFYRTQKNDPIPPDLNRKQEHEEPDSEYSSPKDDKHKPNSAESGYGSESDKSSESEFESEPESEQISKSGPGVESGFEPCHDKDKNSKIGQMKVHTTDNSDTYLNIFLTEFDRNSFIAGHNALIASKIAHTTHTLELHQKKHIWIMKSNIAVSLVASTLSIISVLEQSGALGTNILSIGQGFSHANLLILLTISTSALLGATVAGVTSHKYINNNNALQCQKSKICKLNEQQTTINNSTPDNRYTDAHTAQLPRCTDTAPPQSSLNTISTPVCNNSHLAALT